MKKLLIALAILAVASVAQAELLATWNFPGDGTSGSATEEGGAANIDQVSFSAWSRIGLNQNTTQGFSANNWISTDNVMQFTATVNSGYEIVNTVIAGSANATTTGPGHMIWSVNGSEVAGSAWNTATSITPWSSTIGTLASGVNTLNLYAADSVSAGGGTVAGTGGLRLQTAVTISGDVQSTAPIPEPATMSLLGLGALAMVLRRKIRK